jgi:hypothetical protein
MLLSGCGSAPAMDLPDAGDGPDLLEPAPDLLPTGTMVGTGFYKVLPKAVGDWLFVNYYNGIQALPPDGSPPMKLGIDYYDSSAQDPYLFIWDPHQQLHVFDGTNGSVHTLSTGAAYWNVKASDDGQWVSFVDNYTSASGDLTISHPDGTGKKTLYAGQPTNYNTTTDQCRAWIAPCGGSHFCIERCETGETTSHLTVYDAATDTSTELGAGFGAVHIGTGAVVADQGTHHMLLPTDGTPGVEVPDYQFGYTFFSGKTMFYESTASELKRIDATAGATPVLLQSGIVLLLALTPDRIVYCTPTELYTSPFQPGPALRTDDTFRDFGFVDYGGAPDWNADHTGNLYVNAKQELRLAPLDGSGARALAEDVSGFRAVDGGRVAVASGNPNVGYSLQLVDEHGTVLRSFVTGAESAAAGAHRAAWEVLAGNQYQLWVAPY